MALRADDVDLERDQTLVRRFQAGDGEAFDELYRRYHGRLERFCRKRVADDHTAEEVAQEAFTRALTALPDLTGELRFYPWVSVIAARLCVDSFRRQSRSEPACDLDLGAVPGGQEEIVNAVDDALVVTALGRLAPRHQDVLHLREIDGWSYQRIADHYGVTVGTVETLLFRARRALRREFHLVDRAGLLALPVLGRVIQLMGRARSRIPAWVPSGPWPTTLAAAAAATAAAVALGVAPGSPPARSPVVPPTPQVVIATGGRGGGVKSVSATSPITAPPAGVALSPPVTTAIVTPSDPDSSDPDGSKAATTSTTASPWVAAPSVGVTPTTLGVVPAIPAAPLPTLPSLGGIASALPPVTVPPLLPLVTLPPLTVLPALPGLPALNPDLSTTPDTVLGTAQSTVQQVVGGLLPGHS